MPECARGSEDNLWESMLSFYHAGPRDSTQGDRPSSVFTF